MNKKEPKVLHAIRKELKELWSEQKAMQARRFFKTWKGEYGEGDLFWWLTVPSIKKVAKKYKNLALDDIVSLLYDPIHEVRFFWLWLLVLRYEAAQKQSDELWQKEVVSVYLENMQQVNNWDLVDVSAHKILGRRLLHKPKKILYTMATSEHLWTRRIAIVATWMFIREGKVADTYALAKILLHDSHDLIHKAVGRMLREAGKKDINALYDFLDAHCTVMPRTMLRYAIERIEKNKKAYYMKK